MEVKYKMFVDKVTCSIQIMKNDNFIGLIIPNNVGSIPIIRFSPFLLLEATDKSKISIDRCRIHVRYRYRCRKSYTDFVGL